MSARTVTRFGMLIAAVLGTLGAVLNQSWFEIGWIWIAVWWCFDAARAYKSGVKATLAEWRED